MQAYDDVIPEYHVMETGSNHACYAILNYENKKYSIEMVTVNYDYKSAVKRALKNNRPDWAAGLQSGYLSE
ncbi:MAG: hypothetical protein ABFR36_06535 [Acidobacteriota bacterium]